LCRIVHDTPPHQERDCTKRKTEYNDGIQCSFGDRKLRATSRCVQFAALPLLDSKLGGSGDRGQHRHRSDGFYRLPHSAVGRLDRAGGGVCLPFDRRIDTDWVVSAASGRQEGSQAKIFNGAAVCQSRL
jgi:hypothetical protein